MFTAPPPPNGPRPDPDTYARAWRVFLKSTYKGQPPGEIVVRADHLQDVPQLGLVFKMENGHIVEVIPFGAFTRAAAIDVDTGALLHPVLVTQGVASRDDD